MDLLNTIINSILKVFITTLGPASLTIISILAGIGMLWVFKKTSNPTKIRAAKRRAQAHLLELRIYGEEPSVVWMAQKSLLAWNMRYMGLMLKPAVWLAIPLSLLLIHLESFYGRTPLNIGREAIVTIALKPESPKPVLTAPKGIAIETPGIAIPEEHQVSWRIRPSEPVSGALSFQLNGQTIEKRIEAGPGLRFVPGLRVNSLLGTVIHPDEPRIQHSAIDWIDVTYPDGGHWLIWFTVISMLAALLLKKRFGVVF